MMKIHTTTMIIALNKRLILLKQIAILKTYTIIIIMIIVLMKEQEYLYPLLNTITTKTTIMMSGIGILVLNR